MWDELQKLSNETRVTLGSVLIALITGISFAWKKFLTLRKETAKTKTVEAKEETKQAEEEVQTEAHKLTTSSLKLQQTLTDRAQKYVDKELDIHIDLAEKKAEIKLINNQLEEQKKQIKDLQEIINKRIIVSAEGYSLLIRPLVSNRSLIPFVILDEADATLSLTGKSYLDNLEDYSVYSHIVSSIDTYFKTPARNQLDIIFRLESYGSTSKKWIVVICEKAQEWLDKGKTVQIAWHVDKDDEPMIDDVAYFMDGLTVPHTIEHI